MSPTEKVRSVEGQILAMKEGNASLLRCPYCNCETEPGQMLCCGPMGEIVDAVIERLEFQGAMDHVNKVLDRMN